MTYHPPLTIAMLAILLLATNAWHVYRGLDEGVTQGYRDDVLYETANQLVATTQICTAFFRGKQKDQALGFLKERFPSNLVYVKGSAIYTEWLALRLDARGIVTECIVDDLVRDWAKEAHSHRPSGV